LRALPAVRGQSGDDVEICGICTDSRRVRPGDLFVAIRGGTADGHCFIAEAVRNGAVAVIGELPPAELRPTAEGFSYVSVPSSREAWGWSCAAWHRFPSRSLTLVGVTGTDGKTTTVSLIHAILQAAGASVGMISTVRAIIPAVESGRQGESEVGTGLHTTTPDPPEIQRHLSQMVEVGATHAVLEVTSHGLAQHRVAGCDFDVAVVTNITHEHLDYHGSMAAYRKAKCRLFAGLEDAYRKPGIRKASVLNRDDPSFRYLRPLPAERHVVYAVDRDADVTVEEIELGPDWTRFKLCTPLGDVWVETALVGLYNVYNALAAAAAGVALGVSPESIAVGLSSVPLVPGRMEVIDEVQDFLAVVDFAHTPNALTQALKGARGMLGEEGRLIVVFGCAGLRDREKRRMMGHIAGQLADVVIVTAEDPRTESLEAIMADSAEAARQQGKRHGTDLFLVPDRGAALQTACQLAGAGDVVIACGKGHEQSMCFDSTEYPWDDREAMRLALRGERMETLPTASRSQTQSRRDGT